MPEINNPIINRVVNEQVRPMAEQARNLLVEATAAAPGLTQVLAQLSGADDADIIQDGRLAEGVAPLNVGDLRACAGVLSDIVDQVNADPRLASIRAACVRPVRASS